MMRKWRRMLSVGLAAAIVFTTAGIPVQAEVADGDSMVAGQETAGESDLTAEPGEIEKIGLPEIGEEEVGSAATKEDGIAEENGESTEPEISGETETIENIELPETGEVGIADEENESSQSEEALEETVEIDMGLAEAKANAAVTVVASGTWRDNLSWKITEDLDKSRTLTISGSGKMADFDVESSDAWRGSGANNFQHLVIENGITSVGAHAFRSLDFVDVVLPEGITKIGDYAFFGCQKLESITLPGTLAEVGNQGVSSCQNLTKIIFSQGIRKIETGYSSNAFCYNRNLTQIEFPASLEEIADLSCFFGYFFGCESLASIQVDPENAVYASVDGALLDKTKKILLYSLLGDATSYEIPEGVTKIGSDAFADGTKLTNIVIPASLNECTGYDFRTCSQLTSFSVNSANNTYMAENGVLFDKTQKTLVYYPSGREGQSYVVPESVMGIGDYAFFRAKLNTVTLPSGLTRIGNYAFSGCGELKSLILPGTLAEIGEGIVSGCWSLTEMVLSDGIKKIGPGTFGSTGITSISIPASVEEIDPIDFEGWYSLKTVLVDSGNPVYTSVDDVLFRKDMSALVFYPRGKKDASYRIPSGVKSIEGSIQSDSLKEVYIPGSLREGIDRISPSAKVLLDSDSESYVSINEVIFDREMTTLIYYPKDKEDKSYTVPGGVTSIGNHAFYGCAGLEELILPESLTRIEEDAFYFCTNLKTIALPEKLTYIGANAFRRCESLTEIHLPDYLNYIGTQAFRYCDALNEVTIPGSVERIGDAAFMSSGLGKVTIGKGVKTIGSGAFSGCGYLEEVTIPGSVTEIEYDAFAYCSSLQEVAIPHRIQSIGGGAFQEASALKKVYFAGDVPKFDVHIYDVGYYRNVFENVTADAYYPDNNAAWTEAVRQNYGGSLTWKIWMPVIDKDLEIIIGATDSDYTQGDAGGATIKCSGELSDFVEVSMDGVKVEPSNYTLEEGSTILTFKSSYLDTLSVGEHKVKLTYTYASIDTTLKVTPKQKKGDISGDGKINMADLLMCLHHVSGRKALTGNAFWAADIDDNGKVTMAELLRILHYVSGRNQEL